MRLFESCQYRSYVILWHTDKSVHTRVVKAIDSNIPVFLPFFSFFWLNLQSGGVWASLGENRGSADFLAAPTASRAFARQATSPRTRVRGRRANAGAPPTPRAARAVLGVPVAATAPHATASHSYASVLRARAARPSWHHDLRAAPQTRRPRAAPKSQRESRCARCHLRQRRHRPSIKPHHRATPPQPTRTANPHHDRRSPPKKREFLMTASQAKTTKRPPCRCLFCATQHPWAAASTATSMQAAPQDADCAKKRNKTPLS